MVIIPIEINLRPFLKNNIIKAINIIVEALKFSQTDNMEEVEANRVKSAN